MTKKRLRKSILALIVLVVIVVWNNPLTIYRLYSKKYIPNVFEEMYHTNRRLSGYSTRFKPSFYNMESINLKGFNSKDFYFQYVSPMSLSVRFKGDSLSVGFYNDFKTISISAVDYLSYENERSKTNISFFYNYELSEELIYSHISLEIENKESETIDYLLKEKEISDYLVENEIDVKPIQMMSEEILMKGILEEWFKGNGKLSQFSMTNLGEYRVKSDKFSVAP